MKAKYRPNNNNQTTREWEGTHKTSIKNRKKVGKTNRQSGPARQTAQINGVAIGGEQEAEGAQLAAKMITKWLKTATNKQKKGSIDKKRHRNWGKWQWMALTSGRIC